MNGRTLQPNLKLKEILEELFLSIQKTSNKSKLSKLGEIITIKTEILRKSE